jgi:hypothetical protein
VHYAYGLTFSPCPPQRGQHQKIERNHAMTKAPRIAQIIKAVTEADYKVRHDLLGFYICTTEEGKYEDAGHTSVGFDRRPHWYTANAAYLDAYRLHILASA